MDTSSPLDLDGRDLGEIIDIPAFPSVSSKMKHQGGDKIR